MNWSGVLLIIALFLSNVFSIDFLYNKRYKAVGILNICNLCMTVALAYTFQLTTHIVWVIIATVAIAVIYLLIRLKFSKKEDTEEISFLEENKDEL